MGLFLEWMFLPSWTAHTAHLLRLLSCVDHLASLAQVNHADRVSSSGAAAATASRPHAVRIGLFLLEASFPLCLCPRSADKNRLNKWNKAESENRRFWFLWCFYQNSWMSRSAQSESEMPQTPHLSGSLLNVFFFLQNYITVGFVKGETAAETVKSIVPADILSVIKLTSRNQNNLLC